MNAEDALYEFRQAIEAALYHAVQDSTARYEAGCAIAEALAKVIDAKIAERNKCR